MNQEKSILVQYAELLHQHRCTTAAPVRTFFNQNRKNKTFKRRATVLNKLWHGKAKS